MVFLRLLFLFRRGRRLGTQPRLAIHSGSSEQRYIFS